MKSTYFRFAGDEDEQNHLPVIEWAQVDGIPQDGDDAWVPPAARGHNLLLAAQPQGLWVQGVSA
jgi:hypothetical protein